MSDSDRCRATAARYARLAERSGSAEAAKSYRELERLWLEMASWTDRLDLSGHQTIGKRIHDLAERSGAKSRAVNETLH